MPLSLLLMAPAAGPPRLAKDTAPDVGPALWASREAGEQLPAPEFRHGCSWTGGCWGAWEEAAGQGGASSAPAPAPSGGLRGPGAAPHAVLGNMGLVLTTPTLQTSAAAA